jgi:hypothetical protein
MTDKIRFTVHELTQILRIGFLFGFVFFGFQGFAQNNPDSTGLENIIEPDSINQALTQVQILANDFRISADSLNSQYSQTLTTLERQSQQISSKIDSLQRLHLPSGNLTHKLDSLNTLKQKNQNEFNSKIIELKSKTLGKVDKIEMTPGMQEQVNEFTDKINAFRPGAQFPNAGSLSLPSLSKVPVTEYLPSAIGDVKIENLPGGVSENI